jgi:4-hydroxy-3-methylbut-2-enyl diphosphate reductase
LAGEGYILFLAGEERHGEIAGILGYARQGVPPDGPGLEAAPGESAGCVVVANPREAAAAAEAACRRMGDRKGPAALIAQTTISPEEYRAIGEEILKFFPGLRICDTICGATRDRQDALKELCRSVDAVIVAGGRESANTRRLLSLAQARDKPAWLVEKVGDIPPEIAAYGTVGLSAGASTPDELIDGIRRALENFLPQGRAGRANH